MLSDFNETRTLLAYFRKILKINENPTSDSRVVPCGQDRRTDMVKLIVAFSQFCERAQQRIPEEKTFVVSRFSY